MKKYILFFALTTTTLAAKAQSWTAGTGILYANPTTTKIGIGTTSPQALLHVKNTGECIRLESLSPSVCYMKFYNGSTDLGYMGFNYNPSTSLSLSTNSSYPIIFWTNNTERMRIDASGNVGIGITTPLDQLHINKYINSTTWTTANLRLQSYDQYYGTSHFHHWQIKSESESNGNNVLYIQYGQSTSLTGSPSLSTMAQFSGGMIFVGGLRDINNVSYYLDPANTDISLKVAGKIQTCGKIEAEEIEVKNICAAKINVNISNVADYVFNANYNLLNLNEVEQYVKENNHLPDMPAGKELEEKGMDVAKMNNLLLQKIEELTLYVIKQQKEIDELKNKLK